MSTFELMIPYAGAIGDGRSAMGGWKDAWNITIMAQTARRESHHV